MLTAAPPAALPLAQSPRSRSAPTAAPSAAMILFPTPPSRRAGLLKAVNLVAAAAACADAGRAEQPMPSPPRPHLPAALQCSACCSELPPLPSETLADLQQEEAELNADLNPDEEVRVQACW